MVSFQLELPHSYVVEELPELPGTGGLNLLLRYFPRPKTRPEHDGLWLKVSSAKGNSWIGVFAFGYRPDSALSKVVSSPDPDRVCVVSGGAAYIVTADDPDAWEEVPVQPVCDVRCLPEHGLLVFSDFSKLVALGVSGLAWSSPRLCWDDLKILNVTGDAIEGIGYDPTNPSEKSTFVVDIRTGRSSTSAQFY